MNKFKFKKGRLAEDPLHSYVEFTYKGQHLLGTVKGYEYNDVRGVILLTVYHFNGEPWPVTPTALSVNVIRHPDYCDPSALAKGGAR